MGTEEMVVALVVGAGVVAAVGVERNGWHWWPSFTAHSCCAWRSCVPAESPQSVRQRCYPHPEKTDTHRGKVTGPGSHSQAVNQNPLMAP